MASGGHKEVFDAERTAYKCESKGNLGTWTTAADPGITSAAPVARLTGRWQVVSSPQGRYFPAP